MAHREISSGVPTSAPHPQYPPSWPRRVVVRISYRPIPKFHDPLESLQRRQDRELATLENQEVFGEMIEVRSTEHVSMSLLIPGLQVHGLLLQGAFQTSLPSERAYHLVFGRSEECRRRSREALQLALVTSRAEGLLGSAVWRVEAKRDDGTLVVLLDELLPVGDPPRVRPRFFLRFEGGRCILTEP